MNFKDIKEAIKYLEFLESEGLKIVEKNYKSFIKREPNILLEIDRVIDLASPYESEEVSTKTRDEMSKLRVAIGINRLRNLILFERKPLKEEEQNIKKFILSLIRKIDNTIIYKKVKEDKKMSLKDHILKLILKVFK